MTIQAVIFDMDGVLVDTEYYHYLSWKKFANSLGFDFTESQNESLKGIGRMDTINQILEWENYQASDEDKLQYARQKNEIYLEYIKAFTTDDLQPGVLDFFRELTALGIPYSVGSASKNAAYIIDKMGIRDWFVTVVDGNHTSRSKPDPEVFLLGAKAMDIAPENIVVFEDSEHGLLAAKSAGFRRIGIGSPDTLTNAEAHLDGFENINTKKINAILTAASKESAMHSDLV